MSSTAHFYLKLTKEELLEYYQGYKIFVRVRTYQGFTIKFRAEHLRKWVTPNGVDGEFEIIFDKRNQFVSLRMLRGNGSRGRSEERPRGGFTTSI
jgi:hypothetical protein